MSSNGNFNVTGVAGSGHHLSGNTFTVAGVVNTGTIGTSRTNNSEQTRDHREDHSIQNENLVSVGNGIFYNKNDVIHRGNNTVIYAGYYEVETRKAAIKRLSTTNNSNKLYNTEIRLLRRLNHNNILKYFATYTDNNYHYIATELAYRSLEAYIKQDGIQLNDKELLKLIEESCLGLKCLHDQDIIHRDIKPSNILISHPDHDGHRRAMIADLGISKVHDGTSSTSLTFAGTEGWSAPEALVAIDDEDKTFKPTKECDIFSMGCVIYYVITRGEHPYGKLSERTYKIKNGYASLEPLRSDKFSYFNLIKAMLSKEESKRPQITAVLMHPTFWDGNDKLQFLTDVSNCLYVNRGSKSPTNEKTVKQNIIEELNNCLGEICAGSNWMEQMDQKVQEYAKRWKKDYKINTMIGLIEFIRDKNQHWNEWTEDVKQVFGKTNETYIESFLSKFPHLLVITYVVMQKLKQSEKINSYYNYPNLSNPDFNFEL